MDAILLSHSTLHHLGALPYVVRKLNCNAQIYATTPVWTMGETFLEEALLSNLQASKAFDITDINETFKKINRLRYQEKILLGESKDIQIVPFASGHSLGGTIWKISKETDDIVYAVDYNHGREIICDPCNIDKLGKPTILITDSIMASVEAKVKDSPKLIVQKVQETLLNGGNVLIPSDTAGRSFEILMQLERAWKQNANLSNIGSLVFLSRMSHRSITSASNQLEWMGEAFRKEHEDKHSDPMSFEHVKILKSLSNLENVKHPICVVAATETLDSGFSNALFRLWASHSSNTMILTEKSIKDSIVRKLYEGEKDINVTYFRKVQLQGEELEEHLRQKKADEEAAKQKAREAEQRKEVIIIDDRKTDEEELLAQHEQLYLPENMRYHSQFLMFPCIEKTYEGTVYGIKADELITVKPFDEMEESKTAVEEKTKTKEEKEEEIPYKIVEETVPISVQCSIAYFEFSGRPNGTSVRNILQQLHPRKLILIHGSYSDSELLRKYCSEKKICEQIEVVRENQLIDISLDTIMFKVKLREQLLSETRFVRIGAFDLGFIEGTYQFPEKSEEHELNEPGKTIEQIPFIAPRQQSKGHQTLLLGEIKLHSLSTILQSKGFKAKFKVDGGLIVNDKILITLDSSEKVNVEGSFCKDYFELRKIVYNQFQKV